VNRAPMVHGGWASLDVPDGTWTDRVARWSA